MNITELITHPYSLLVSQLSIISVINGFTAPGSPIRTYVGLPVVSYLAWLSATTSFERMGTPFLGGALGSPPTGFLLQYIDTALIGKWDIDAGGPRRILGGKFERNIKTEPSSTKEKDSKPEGTQKSPLVGAYRFPDTGFWSRLRFGFLTIADIRGTNKPWESKHLARWDSSDPERRPSRLIFLAIGIFKLVLCNAVVKYFGETAALLSAPGDPKVLYAVDRIFLLHRLPEITAAELGLRLVTTVKQFLLIMCTLESTFQFIALPLVGLGMTDTQDFRPFFGSPLNAYNVRGFWGPFFHELWRRRFSDIASVVTYDFLQLSKRSLAARYTSTFVVFWLSGFVHFVHDVAEGRSWRESGAFTFFLAQGVAIAIEDFIGWLTGLRNKNPNWLMRCLGYGWVLAVLAAVGPHWVYPALYSNAQ